MWHTINIYRRVEEITGKVFWTAVTFKTSDIASITTANGMVWLSLNQPDEENGCVSYRINGNDSNFADVYEKLLALKQVLEETPSYFKDKCGNIFPFEHILYLSKSTFTAVFVGGAAIRFHHIEEWPQLSNDYVNWLDVYK